MTTSGEAELPLLTPALLRSSESRIRARGVDMPGPMVLDLPEKALQFGTGMALRALVEDFIDRANRKGVFGGRIVAVGASGRGKDPELNLQGGLFTLIVRGAESAKLHTAQGAAGLGMPGASVAVGIGAWPQVAPPSSERRIVASLSRAVSAVEQWDEVLACARDPQLEVIFSNESEMGVVLDEHDTPDMTPPRSFPGQLTRFLLERARAFDYVPEAAPVVIPCEMLEDNGDRLRAIVLELTRRWQLEPEFLGWVERAVAFCNTLTDRIVTGGSPAPEEQAQLDAELGYVDRVVTTCEPYRLLVIEAGLDLWPRLRFVGADPGIVLAEDIRPFRERKLRILNGAHTILVPLGLLCGCETVLDAVQHPLVGPFLRRVLFEEILPTVDAPGAEQFTLDVLDRLANPLIRHALVDITFQQTTKMGVRVVPSIRRFSGRKGKVPASLAFGFAAYLLYMRGELPRARLEAGLAVPPDDRGERVRAAWERFGDERLAELVTAVSSDDSLWEVDLRSAAPGFARAVTEALTHMLRDGVPAALEAHLALRADGPV